MTLKNMYDELSLSLSLSLLELVFVKNMKLEIIFTFFKLVLPWKIEEIREINWNSLK